VSMSDSSGEYSFDYIVKRDGSLVPFDKQKIVFAVLRAAVAVGGRDRETAERIADEVVEYLKAVRKEGAAESLYPTVEEVQDAVEKILIEEGHAKTAKAYIVYRYEHALKRKGRESLTYSSDNIPYRMLWETLNWAVDHDCYTLSHLRGFVDTGGFGELVRISEEFYEEQISQAVSQIRSRLDDLRVVIVSGPSSSGKTTTTHKIAEALAESGKRLVPLEVDNYFFDLREHPEDPYGDRDFETPQALDMRLLNEHLSRLLEGRSIQVPFYNFKTGRREGTSQELALEKDDIVLIDSLHGLYEPMTEAVPEKRKFTVYIETLAQIKDDRRRFIRWTDIRMLRRMVRDMQFRNYGPRQTLLHWYLVRRSELRHIVSRINNADCVVNSFMPSELPVMKRRLAAYFREFVREFEGVRERADAYDRAVRVQELFDQVPDVEGEARIPESSLLREFIGGGIWEG